MTLSVLLAEALEYQPGYYVIWNTYVDHPEKRSDSHRDRTRDTKTSISNQKVYLDSKGAKAKAIAHAKSLLDGDEDFGSEYTRSVEVIYVADGQSISSGRQVMKKVKRERGEDGKIRVNTFPDRVT